MPNIFLFPILLFISFSLTGCAESQVSRDVASGIDLGTQNAKHIVENITEGDIADTYQNSNQATKGAILGGAAGALTGYLTGVGALPGTAIGAILGASYGGYIDYKTTPRDQLINRGVTVIVLGDQIMIVIPSFRIFYPGTPHIKPKAVTTLELVADYMNKYVKTLVRVTAYTAKSGSDSVDFALSQKQAEQVARILSASGLDSRLLYAVGCGSTKLVEFNTLDWESVNYRIELTFEKLHV